jgi:hypothetical protein
MDENKFIVISREGMEDEIGKKMTDESWKGISREIQKYVQEITEDFAQSV